MRATANGKDAGAGRMPSAFDVVWIAAAGAFYFFAHQLAFLFPASGNVLMAVWPPAGVGLAALLLCRRPLWPVVCATIFAAGTAANIFAGRPLAASLGFMIANTLESLGWAWVLHRTFGESATFGRVREVLALIVVACGVNSVTSLVGAGAAHLLAGTPFWLEWKTWVVADGLGIMLVAPAAVTWARRLRMVRGNTWAQWAELAAFTLLWCGLVWLTFNLDAVQGTFQIATYFLITLLVWPALRLGPSGATLALVILAAGTLSSRAVLVGPLPWGGEDQTQRLIFAQLYLALATVTGLLLAASYSESRTHAREYRTLIDGLPDIVTRRDASGRILFISPSVEGLLGMRAGRFIGKTSRELGFPEDYCRAVEDATRAALQTGSTVDVLATIPGRNGPLTLSTRLVPERDPRGVAQSVLSVARDITSQTRADEALKKSESRFRTIVEHSNDGFAFLDRSGTVMFRSPSYERIDGFSGAERMGHDDFEAVHPEDLPEVRRALADLLRVPDGTSRLEYRIRHRDGTWRWIDAAVQNLLERPDLGAMVSVARDVTERRRAEERLRESEGRLQRVLASFPDAIYTIDLASGKVRFMNRESFCGYPQDEVKAPGSLLSRLHPDDRPRVEQAWRQIRAGTVVPDLEYRLRAKDGALEWIEQRVARISADSHESLILVVLSVITGRKRDEALAAARARLLEGAHSLSMQEFLRRVIDECETLTDSSIGFFCFADSATSSVVFQNWSSRTVKEFCTATGAGAHYQVSRAGVWADCIRERRPVIVNDYPALPRRGSLPAGHAQVTRFLSVPLWRGGEIVAILGVGNKAVDYDTLDVDMVERLGDISWDIVERKRGEDEKAALEARLEQSQKMEIVGRLAGGVAHDFNNMLGVILGHVELALDHAGSSQPLQAHLAEICRSARRSADLTRQLLAFARKQPIAPRVLDLNPVVEGALGMLKRLIGEDIRLEWKPGAPLWPLMVDSSQVDQVLGNLCVNARDAITGGGCVVIQTSNGVLDEAWCAAHAGALPGEYVVLAVSDDGAGMDEKTKSHLFEPFFTTKEVGKGTGLGLATVYGIVRQNGGFIDVVSYPGRGSTVTIYLPRYTGSHNTEASGGETRPAAGGTETILLVEDEPAYLNLTTKVLERLGYTVVGADTPAEAIRVAEERGGVIDLLVTDVVMPQMSGRELAAKLGRLFEQMKCLYMSGYTTDVIARHGVLEEGLQFIQKPYSARDLAAKVRKALEGQRPANL